MLGGVCVALFFALSAFLFGEKWRSAGKKGFELKGFLKKRFVRIFIPLWISLVFIVALEVYAHHPLHLKTILFNILGLSWAKPFVWAGHLWYITMILILYLEYLVISRLRLDKISTWMWIVLLAVITAIMIGRNGLFNTVSKVTIPLTVFYAAMVFTKGDTLMSFCQDHKLIISVVAIAFFLITWYLHLGGIFQEYTGIATVLNSISGLLLFFAIVSVFQGLHTSKVITWLSGISYELYLIHLTVMVFVRQFIDGHSVAFYCVSVPLIILCSFLLHKVSECISSLLFHKAIC